MSAARVLDPRGVAPSLSATIFRTPSSFTKSDMGLDETLILQRAHHLNIEVRGVGEMIVTVGGQSFECGWHGLAVLDAFAQPATVADAMALLKGRSTGVQDWLDLIGTIETFRTAKILIDPGAVSQQADSDPGQEVSSFHVMMLDDRERTSRFIQAIEDTIQEGDVVIDLGTGTGILALAAARAGAKHVYAIEAGDIAGAAEALIEANGFSDRITVVRGWSTQVELPQAADLLVSEIIGGEPLSERVLENTRDAFKRHLKPNARMVPRGMRVFGLPVPRPEDAMALTVFTDAAARKWGDWYGFDFSGMVAPTPEKPPFVLLADREVRDLPRLSAPVLLGEIDFATNGQLTFEATGVAAVDVEGSVGGVAIYFEVELAPGLLITNDPAQAGGTNHWANPVAILPNPLDVKPGDELEILYRYGAMNAELTCRLKGT
jgi:SAM-dependent methyltransferase